MKTSAVHDPSLWPAYDATRAEAGYLNIQAALSTASTTSANTELHASQLLWTGSQPITWGSVAWNSVAWNSVAWNSVAWNSVYWGSYSCAISTTPTATWQATLCWRAWGVSWRCATPSRMASDRPYQRGKLPEEVVAELVRCAGSHFDPMVCKAFINIVEREGSRFVGNSAREVMHKQPHVVPLLMWEHLELRAVA